MRLCEEEPRSQQTSEGRWQAPLHGCVPQVHFLPLWVQLWQCHVSVYSPYPDGILSKKDAAPQATRGAVNPYRRWQFPVTGNLPKTFLPPVLKGCSTRMKHPQILSILTQMWW